MTGPANVRAVAEAGLCIGCGICKAICPAKCIEYTFADGMYLPRVDETACRQCGQCLQICPGRGCDFAALYHGLGQELPENPYAGHCLDAFVARARDEIVLKEATSGGVVTALVRHLLQKGDYTCAFLVDGHDCSAPLRTARKTARDDLLTTCKSRYVPVQQTAAVEYLLRHPTEPTIFVGVPCFVQSLLRVMRQRHIDRRPHLLVGLFCASTMNYHILDYFASCVHLPPQQIKTLHFRSKCAGADGKLCRAWPGDVHLLDKAGNSHLLSRNVRTDAKGYFTPLRCLYCVDKLNQFADVSVGDNYTGRNAHRMGSSSVIIRTQRGMVARDERLFHLFPETLDAISEGQKLADKRKNRCYQQFAGTGLLPPNQEMPLPQDWEKWRPQYEREMSARALGAQNDLPAIHDAIRQARLEKKKRHSFWRRLLRLFARLRG